MFSNRWRHLLGAACLGAIALSGHSQDQQKQPERQANEEQASTDQLPVPLPVLIVETEEAAAARQSAEEENRTRQQRDLLAQEGMDAAAQLMTTYAFWQTFLIALGTGALVWTLILTGEANRGFSSVGRAQLRPYVLPAQPVVIRAHKDAPAHLNICWENCGKTPTVNARCNHFITITEVPLAEDFAFHYHDPQRPPARVLIGPGKTQRTVGPSISSADIANVIAGSNFAYIWAFIEYEDSAKPRKHYRTEYCFRLKHDPRTGFEWTFENFGPFNGADQDCLYPPEGN